LRPSRWAGAFWTASLLAGCGGESSGPNQPPPPDLSTPRLAIRALADVYSRREFDAAVALHSPDFRFYPAQPESIPFLEPGDTFWEFDRESLLLERLLVPERISWIDQVLLEPTLDEVVDSTATLTRITAKTDLAILIGNVDLVHSRSWVDYIYERSATGTWLLVEQRERLYAGSGLTYGQLKVRVEDPPTVNTTGVGLVTDSTAVLRGRVTPNGLATTCWFEWGVSYTYGSSSPPQSAGSGTASTDYEHGITGLTPATEYHYRFVASSLWGTIRGGDRAFWTSP
jgi:hypothetical protein